MTPGCLRFVFFLIPFVFTIIQLAHAFHKAGFLPPYENAFCKKNYSPDFIHYGCCSKSYPASHCFLNDWETRDAVCVTQNLHPNRFSFNCSNSLFDRYCTVPKGTCFCCSADAPVIPGNRPTRPPPIGSSEPKYCGTIMTDRFNSFRPGNLTLLNITEETELGESHFIHLSYALKDGMKYVNVTNSNCIVTVCHTDSWDGNCLHFHQNGSNNSYSGYGLDSQYSRLTTSVSCGCRTNQVINANCTFANLTQINSGVEVMVAQMTCQPRGFNGDTCAILYQEWGCESCFYDEVHLTARDFTFKPTNYAVIRSIRVNEGCSVRASSDKGFQDFNRTMPIIPEFFSKNDTLNGKHSAEFKSFDCTCGPRTVTDEVGLSAGIIATITIIPVIVVSGLAMFLLRRRKQKVKFTEKETEELKVELFGDLDVDTTGDQESSTRENNTGNNIGFSEGHSLKKQNIEVYKNKFLGKGNYGVVFKGSLFFEEDQTKVDCAIKTVDKRTARIDDLKLLMNEIRIMSVVGVHANVVSFLGYYCNFHPSKWEFLCLMELCVGSLHEYLCLAKNSVSNSSSTISTKLAKAGYVYYDDQNNNVVNEVQADEVTLQTRIVTLENMKTWCAQIADGMEYLISRNLLHIDLATRNILLSVDLTSKISDFGLSKKLYDSLYYKKVQGGNIWLPMKWSAFESLMSLKFSAQSDIWSYGVTIWEIFSLGDEPYPEVGDMVDLIRLLNSGKRLDCPKNCDQATYSLMKQCWELKPGQRPCFNELRVKRPFGRLNKIPVRNGTSYIDTKSGTNKVEQADSERLIQM